MGTIRNEMTIVQVYSRKLAEELRDSAISAFLEASNKDDPGGMVSAYDMVSPIIKSYINEEYSFVINGECSKIGWDTSDLFHDTRMKWCEKHENDAYIVVVNFGEGDEPCKIVFDNTGCKHVQDED